MTALAESSAHPSPDDARAHLYDAECALHAARQSHVDPWIRSAGDKLHEAVEEYLATLPEPHRDAG